VTRKGELAFETERESENRRTPEPRVIAAQISFDGLDAGTRVDARGGAREIYSMPSARTSLFALALGAALATHEGISHAAEPASPPVELRHDLDVELPTLAGLATVVVGFRLLRDGLEPSSCRFCDSNVPGRVNAIDGWFRGELKQSDTRPANVVSYVLAFGLAPASAAGLTILAAHADHREGEDLVNVIAIAEAGFGAMLVTEVLEFSTLRMRPYVHAIEDPAERDRVIAQTGAFHSFPAGHVVETFGLAAASGVVASRRGYRLAPLVWGVGLTLGLATAYTRVAADRHYFTDVLAGAAIGTVVGGAIPLLFHPQVPRHAGAASARLTRVAVVPSSQGMMLGFGGTF
jgi:membrane-associated phospholipid phosphatase